MLYFIGLLGPWTYGVICWRSEAGAKARPFMFFLFFFFAVIVACEQALHLGDILKSSRARGTREEIRVLSRLASLVQIGELARRLPWLQKLAIITLLLFYALSGYAKVLTSITEKLSRTIKASATFSTSCVYTLINALSVSWNAIWWNFFQAVMSKHLGLNGWLFCFFKWLAFLDSSNVVDLLQ